jgi:hypothetical protein
MRCVRQHFKSVDSVRLQWAVEDQEPGKFKPTLYLIPSEFVDLFKGIYEHWQLETSQNELPSPQA